MYRVDVILPGFPSAAAAERFARSSQLIFAGDGRLILCCDGSEFELRQYLLRPLAEPVYQFGGPLIDNGQETPGRYLVTPCPSLSFNT